MSEITETAQNALAMVGGLREKFPSVSAHSLLLVTLINTHLGKDGTHSTKLLEEDLVTVLKEQEPSKLYAQVVIGERTNGVSLVIQIPDLTGGLEELQGEALAQLVSYNLPLAIKGKPQKDYVRELVTSFRDSPNPEWRKLCKYRKAWSAYVDGNYSVQLVFEGDIDKVKQISKG